MRRTISVLATLLTVLFIGRVAFAETIVINYSDRGWYRTTGFHSPSNQNYISGDYRGIFEDSDYRNFFVFDLSGVLLPIESAKLALFLPAGQSTPGYQSADQSENYELHDVVTPIFTLLNGTGGVAAHTDLGSGTIYGSRTITAADQGSVVEIALNSSAIAALNSSDGLFGIGGSVTTLDEIANNEVVFSFASDAPFVSQLRLTLVPEPSSGLLCLIGIVATQLRRNRRRAQVLTGYRKVPPDHGREFAATMIRVFLTDIVLFARLDERKSKVSECNEMYTKASNLRGYIHPLYSVDVSASIIRNYLLSFIVVRRLKY